MFKMFSLGTAFAVLTYGVPSAFPLEGEGETKVTWETDFTSALNASRKSQKPILLWSPSPKAKDLEAWMDAHTSAFAGFILFRPKMAREFVSAITTSSERGLLDPQVIEAMSSFICTGVYSVFPGRPFYLGSDGRPIADNDALVHETRNGKEKEAWIKEAVEVKKRYNPSKVLEVAWGGSRPAKLDQITPTTDPVSLVIAASQLSRETPDATWKALLTYQNPWVSAAAIERLIELKDFDRGRKFLSPLIATGRITWFSTEKNLPPLLHGDVAMIFVRAIAHEEKPSDAWMIGQMTGVTPDSMCIVAIQYFEKLSREQIPERGLLLQGLAAAFQGDQAYYEKRFALPSGMRLALSRLYGVALYLGYPGNALVAEDRHNAAYDAAESLLRAKAIIAAREWCKSEARTILAKQ